MTLQSERMFFPGQYVESDKNALRLDFDKASGSREDSSRRIMAGIFQIFKICALVLGYQR